MTCSTCENEEVVEHLSGNYLKCSVCDQSNIYASVQRCNICKKILYDEYVKWQRVPASEWEDLCYVFRCMLQDSQGTRVIAVCNVL